MFIILIYKLPQVALAVKNPPANEADIRNSDSIPGLGRSSGEGNGNPLQYSCLDNPMDKEAWQATVHGVAKSWTQLKWLSPQVALLVKNQRRRHKRRVLDPWLVKIPWRRKWQSTPTFLPGESHGQRSLAGYSPGGCKESGMTEGT